MILFALLASLLDYLCAWGVGNLPIQKNSPGFGLGGMVRLGID